MATNKQRRGGHIATITNIIKKVDEELNKPDPEIISLEHFKEELLYQRQTVSSFDAVIQAEETEEQALLKDITQASNVRMSCGKTISKIDSFLKTKLDRNPTNQSLPNAGKTTKLPYINLIKFDGDPLKYHKFWDLFRSTIHERTDISSTSKFHYLISQLEGEAAKLLSGFDSTSAEYEEAINLLQETYGKTRIITRARLNALMDIPPALPTVNSLSDFRATYEGHLRALKSQGCNVKDAGYVFAEILLRKLPDITKDHLNRTHL